MAIQYVGGVAANRAGSTSTTTQSLSGTLTGGLATTPSDGDLIIVTCVTGTQARNPNQAITTPSGFTTIGTQLNPTGATNDTSLQVSYKFRSGTGDNTITIPSSGNTADGQAWAVQVFRGVDPTTPLDVAAVSATGTGTTRMDPPSITPVTVGAFVVLCGGAASATGAAMSISGDTNALNSIGVDTTDGQVFAAYVPDWTSGAVNLAASTTGSAVAGADSWAMWSIALRPFVEPGVNTITDQFTTLDTVKWPTRTAQSGGSITASGGLLVLAHGWDISNPAWPPARTEVYSTAGRFDGSETYWLYKPLATDDNGAGNAHKAYVHMGVFNQTNLEGVGFSHAPANEAVGSLTCRVFNNVQDEWWQDVGTISGYDPNGAHAYLRVRSSGTTWFWDTAPENGGAPGTWTNRFSYSHTGTGVTFDDLPGFLASSARIHFEAYHWEDTFQSGYVVEEPRFDNVNTVGSTAHTSVANPAVYAISATATGATIARVSNALPATFSVGTAAAVTSLVARVSIANPATFAFTAADAFGSIGLAPGQSSALAAVFAVTAAPATGNIGRVSVALPAAMSVSAFPATGLMGWKSTASPATFGVTGFPTTDVIVPFFGSQAAAATFSITAFPTTVRRTYTSQAEPYHFVVNALATEDTHTGEEEQVVFESPPPAAELTEIEFLEWLQDEDAVRVVLVETQCLDANGNVQLLYFGSSGFVTKLEDGVTNARYYLPLMVGGLDFEQTIDIDLSGRMSYGDIELDNIEGDLDWMFGNHWQYQPVRAFVGDARWPRRDFRQIFDGVIEDIDSSERNTVNVKLRDKMFRLDMPLHETKVGGTGPDAEQLVPVCFGECHNITPVLKDPTTLTYVYHVRDAESVFEVRDNGVPVQRITSDDIPSGFTLPKQPYGRITCSVQGDYDSSDFGYRVDVGGLIWRIALNWGTEVGKRFTLDDMDWENFNNFVANHPQAVGLFADERMTVREACQELAAAVGARLTMTAPGKLQLIKLQVPPVGTPIDVTESDMVGGTLMIDERMKLVASIRLGFCKNWTVQEDTAGGLPEEHKAMFAREWYTTTLVNDVVRDAYNMWGEAEQENSLLLQRADANAEAGRRLWLRSAQRHVYKFVGFADLIFTPVGAPMRITHRRFGLSGGKVGQVVGVAVNWLTSQVTIRVLI